MVSTPRRYFVEALTVRRFEGESSVGRVYADPVSILGKVEHKRRVVLDSEGDEVVSDFTLRTAPEHADLLTPGSLVEHAGRTVTIIATRTYNVRGRDVYTEAVA